jgi:hypothetical protein
MEGTTIGNVVEAITRRYDAAQATGEWPDRPRWLTAPRPPAAPPVSSPCRSCCAPRSRNPQETS